MNSKQEEAARPAYTGEALRRFRFDLLPVTKAGNLVMTVLLTAETVAGEVLAWCFGQTLAEELCYDMNAAAKRLGQTSSPDDPAVAAFLSMPLVELLPGAWVAGRDLAPKVILMEAHPSVYLLDVSGPDGIARRFSLPSGLALVFVEQLGEVIETIS